MSHDFGSAFPIVPQYGLEWWGCDGQSVNDPPSGQLFYLGGHVKNPNPFGYVLSTGLHHIAYRRTHHGSPFPGPLTYTLDIFDNGVNVASIDASESVASSQIGTPRFMLGGCYQAPPVGATATGIFPTLFCKMATGRLINYARSDADIAADAAYTLAGNVHPIIPTTVGCWQLQDTLLDAGPNGFDMTVVTGIAAFTGLGGGSPLRAFDFDGTRGVWTAANVLLKCTT
jgi:hypothetical protein